jgi:exopolysaccharide biosynthesis polyprenyl glycosylphosphotransferase
MDRAPVSEQQRVRVARRLAAAPPKRGRAARQYARLRLRVGLTDVLMVEAALCLAWLITQGSRPLPATVIAMLLVMPFITPMVFGAFRLYSLSRISPAEEFRRLLAAVSVSWAGLLVIAFWAGRQLDRQFIALVYGLTIVLAMLTRRLWHVWMGRARGKGNLVFRTLIVGSNDEARRLAQVVDHRRVGFEVVGYVPTRQSTTPLDGLPAYEDVDAVAEAIRLSGADCVFVASSAVTPEEMTRVTKAVRLQGVEVRVSANISEILSTRLTVQPVGNIMALSLNPVRLTGFQAGLKRTMDVVVSSLGLLVCLPLWAMLALAIKIDSRGAVLYRQERVGQRTRHFQILKFRTMVQDADAKLESLKHLNEATGPLFKLKRDPRITRVGRWLRAWSLDELPQLWNVLRGDMSLVGPRPPLLNEVAQYEDWHFDRLEVRPGMTGLWQVRGRSQLPFDDYVRLDLFYIENWSIGYDLYILAKTLPAILSHKGAF